METRRRHQQKPVHQQLGKRGLLFVVVGARFAAVEMAQRLISRYIDSVAAGRRGVLASAGGMESLRKKGGALDYGRKQYPHAHSLDELFGCTELSR